MGRNLLGLVLFQTLSRCYVGFPGGSYRLDSFLRCTWQESRWSCVQSRKGAIAKVPHLNFIVYYLLKGLLLQPRSLSTLAGFVWSSPVLLG